MSRSICFAGILCVGVGAALAVSAEQGSNRAEREKKLQELLVARAKTADDALNATITGHQEDGTPILQFLLVEQKRFTADLEVAKTPAEKLAAYERHLRSLRETERKLYALYVAGSKGGEPDLYFTVKLTRETAEIELLKVRLQSKDRSADAKTLQELLAARVKTADIALNATIVNHWEDGTPFLQYLLVEQKAFNAHLELANAPAEKLTEYEQHLRNLQETERKCEALYLAGSKGGEADLYFTVKLAREMAEIELLKVRLQNKDRAADDKKLPELLAARVKTANQALNATINSQHEDGLPLVQYLYVEQRLFYAELDFAKSAADRIAAYERRVRRASATERATKKLFDSGDRAGAADLYFAIKLVLETAEIELLKAQIRAANGAKQPS